MNDMTVEKREENDRKVCWKYKVANVQNLPIVPNVQNLSNLPNVPNVQNLPNVPSVPNVTYVSNSLMYQIRQMCQIS